MEVVKTWIVNHENGRTPTGTCWTDVPENISEERAENYINEAKILSERAPKL